MLLTSFCLGPAWQWALASEFLVELGKPTAGLSRIAVRDWCPWFMGFVLICAWIPSVLVSRALGGNSESLWVGVPCHVVWLPLWACRKRPPLHLRAAAWGMLLELFVSLAPLPRAAGWGLPAVAAQLSDALLHCFKGCASTGALEVFCLTSSWVQAWFELSPKQLFGILLVSYILMG